MTRVRYTRRLGQHAEGSVHDVRGSQALWLVQRGYAVYAKDQQPAAQTEPSTPPTTDTTTGEQAGQDGQPEPQATEQQTKAPTHEELKAQAKNLGLPTSGTKPQLQDRIEQHLAAQTSADSTDDDTAD